ncbi:MAG: hypothetical protein ACRD0Q_02895 [Acidimicrobiales bacterium]
MSVVWECGSCGERSLERRCRECNLFCSRIGEGGECPACAELVASAELEGRGAGAPVVGVDVLDAIELAEILDYVAEWLADAPPAVATSLGDYGGGPGAREVLLEALSRHGRALLGTVAS